MPSMCPKTIKVAEHDPPRAPLPQNNYALSSKASVQEKLARVVELQHLARIFDAVELFDTLPNDVEGQPTNENVVKSLGGDIPRLVAEVQELKDQIAKCHDEEGYRVCADAEYKLLYRQANHIHKFIFEVTLEASVSDCVALAWEFDLVQTWNCFTRDTLRLLEPSFCRLWVYCAIWLPWPIPQRDVVLCVRGFDLLDSKKMMAFLVESHADAPFGSAPITKSSKGRVGIDIEDSGGYLVPLSGSHTKGRLHFNVNPHIPMVPEWLVNFVLSMMIPWIISMVMKFMKTTFQESTGNYQRRKHNGDQPLYVDIDQRVGTILEEGI